LTATAAASAEEEEDSDAGAAGGGLGVAREEAGLAARVAEGGDGDQRTRLFCEPSGSCSGCKGLRSRQRMQDCGSYCSRGQQNKSAHLGTCTSRPIRQQL